MADNNLQASFRKLMRYAQNLAEYEQGIAEGIIDDNVFVIVLEEKVAKFKGQTFDWSPLDISSLATKAEVIDNEEVHAAALNDLNDRIGAIEENVSGGTVSKEEFESTVTTITESVEGKADTTYVNTELGKKADTTYVNTELGKKADTTYVDEKFGNIDFSTLATKEEVQNLTNEIIDNEEVHAAALNDLNDRINNIGTGGGGSAGGGVLRVWINEENTQEQIAENISTYNEIQRNLSAIVYAVAETQMPYEGGTLDVAVSYPVVNKNDVSHLEEYSTGGYLLVISVLEQETTYQMNIVLSSDGTVDILL